MGPILAALIATCAPLVHPVTMDALIRVESAGNPNALSINRPARHIAQGTILPTFRQPQSPSELRAVHNALKRQGFTTSVGLAQINTEHLLRFGLTLDQLLDPCTNLRVAQAILLDCSSKEATGTDLKQILSCFNSGNPSTGLKNGYVSRIQAMAITSNKGVLR